MIDRDRIRRYPSLPPKHRGRPPGLWGVSESPLPCPAMPGARSADALSVLCSQWRFQPEIRHPGRPSRLPPPLRLPWLLPRVRLPVAPAPADLVPGRAQHPRCCLPMRRPPGFPPLLAPARCPALSASAQPLRPGKPRRLPGFWLQPRRPCARPGTATRLLDGGWRCGGRRHFLGRCSGPEHPSAPAAGQPAPHRPTANPCGPSRPGPAA